MSAQRWPRFQIEFEWVDAIPGAALVMGVCLVAVLAASVALSLTRADSRSELVGWLRWYLRRGTVRDFAQAVSSGDIEGAEANAARLLAPSQRLLPGLRDQLRSWDEHAVRHGDRCNATSQFREADGLRAWCPTYARTSSCGLEVLRLGRTRALELTVLSRTWPNADCVVMTAEIDGAEVYGQALLRPLIERNGRFAF